MLALAGTFVVLFFTSSFCALSASNQLQAAPYTQEKSTINSNDFTPTSFDSFCDFIGLESSALDEDEKKGLSTQQQAFEQCLKDSLQTKKSLDFYLKIATACSILLTAISTWFIIQETRPRRNY